MRAASEAALWRSGDLCAAAGCHRPEIMRLVESGLLRRFAGGYCKPEAVAAVSHREEDVALALKFPDGVLVLGGACRRWGMGEAGVAKDAVLVPLGSAYRDTSGGAEIMRTRHPALLGIGVSSEELLPGIFFRITVPERTLCDVWSNRFKRSSEERSGALVGFVREHGLGALPRAEMMAHLLGSACGRAYCPDLSVAAATLGDVAPHMDEGASHGPR